MDAELRCWFPRAYLEDISVRRGNVTYIIDGNNFIVEERRVKPPLCIHLHDFLRRIDQWIRFEMKVKNRRIEVYVVFDPGAIECRVHSMYAETEVAEGEKADALILRTARKIRKKNPTRIVRIISNDEKDEFAVLKSEGFELITNDFLSKKINREMENHNREKAQSIQELIQDYRAGRDSTDQIENLAYIRHIRRLEDKSNPLRTHLQTIRALRHFQNDGVVSYLEGRLEDDTNVKIRRRILQVLLHLLNGYSPGQSLTSLKDTVERVFYEATDIKTKELANRLLFRLNAEFSHLQNASAQPEQLKMDIPLSYLTLSGD